MPLGVARDLPATYDLTFEVLRRQALQVGTDLLRSAELLAAWCSQHRFRREKRCGCRHIALVDRAVVNWRALMMSERGRDKYQKAGGFRFVANLH